MRRRTLPVCLLLLATTALRAQVEVEDGTVTVRVLYQGQQITNCNGLLKMLSDDLGSFVCGTTRTGQPAGNFSLREAFRPVVTPIPFTVVNGQTTIVDVELSPYVGEITGTFPLNGQVPPPGTVTAAADFPRMVNSSGTDSTGRFRFLAFVGAGNGRAGTAAFSFLAVASQTRDLGLVGVPTLDSAIVSKAVTLPAKTWQIRILNTSAVKAATAAQLDHITFTQTTGAANRGRYTRPRCQRRFPRKHQLRHLHRHRVLQGGPDLLRQRRTALHEDMQRANAVATSSPSP